MKFVLALIASLAASTSAFVPASPAFVRTNMAVFSTLDKVKEIAASQLGKEVGDISPESTFEELGADSLDQVELVMAVEEEFDVEIDDTAAGELSCVQDVIDYIEKSS